MLARIIHRTRIIQRVLDLERAVVAHLTVSELSSLVAPHIRLACRLGEFYHKPS
jgi:hypothetical protein